MVKQDLGAPEIHAIHRRLILKVKPLTANLHFPSNPFQFYVNQPTARRPAGVTTVWAAI